MEGEELELTRLTLPTVHYTYYLVLVVFAAEIYYDQNNYKKYSNHNDYNCKCDTNNSSDTEI